MDINGGFDGKINYKCRMFQQSTPGVSWMGSPAKAKMGSKTSAIGNAQ